MKNLLEYLQRCIDDPMWPGHVEMPKPIIKDLAQIVEEHNEFETLFDLQWKADQRAIKRWQAAHPGNDMVWPDRADMVVWLIEQHDAHVQGRQEPEACPYAINGCVLENQEIGPCLCAITSTERKQKSSPRPDEPAAG